jgi:hypothetical protein
MSVSTANICEAVLTTLMAEDVQSPDKILPTTGVLGALLSAENRNAAPTVKEAYSDGHRRGVRLAYKQRAILSEVDDAKDCGPGEENPYLEIDFDITTYRQKKWKVKESTVRLLCKAYSEIGLQPASLSQSAVQANINRLSGSSIGLIREMGNEFMYQANALAESIKLELLTQMSLAVGGYPNLVASPQTYQVQNSAANGGGPWFEGISAFTQQMRQFGWMGSPHVVHDFGALDRMIGINATQFCCSEIGVNFQEVYNQFPFRAFSDYLVNDVAGGNVNDAYVFYPGAANFIQYLEYKGNLGGKIDNIWRMTIPMPGIPGMNVDLRIIENGCDEDYDFIMGTYFDLFTAPDDMYKTGDRLDGVNGIVKAVFSQAA